MDNAGIHKAKDVRYYLTRSENKFSVIFNAVNRPDCNGIEEIWGYAKRIYKDRIAWLKANPQPWDITKEVTDALDQVPDQIAVTYVKRGWETLMVAKPVSPPSYEKSRQK